MAVIYTLILGFCYKSLNAKIIVKIFKESAMMTGIICFLVGVSGVMAFVMAFTQIPNAISRTLLSITDNQVGILLIINAILLFAGTFMDIAPAILIFTPIFFPICKQFGMTPVHFGIMLTYNLCIGCITPPVGNILFVGIKVGRTTLERVFKQLFLYYIAITCVLMLVTFIPQIST